MQKTDDLIARVTRDVQIIETMIQTLFSLEIGYLIEEDLDGTEDGLGYSCKIEGLNAALHIIAEQLPKQDLYD